MTFLYPLGLIGLIGIPILILVYVIKSKYTEQTVSSTYLWTLSTKFLKRRNPISKLTGIIALIIQLLAITVLSFTIAHPVFTLKGAAKEYLFLLDASAGMSMTADDGTSSFDRAKAEIGKIIDSSALGSAYTLIHIGNETAVIYEHIDNKEQAKLLLSEAEQSYVGTSDADALKIAQSYFSENPSLITYVVTDKQYSEHNNVNVINVSGTEPNAALGELTVSQTGGRLVLDGSVINFGSVAEMTVRMYIDGSLEAADSYSFSAPMDSSMPFRLEGEVKEYSYVRAVLEYSDATPLDNEQIIYNQSQDKSYSTLLVSDTPFFIEQAFASVLSSGITVIPTESYTESTRGYSLYIFDSFTPSALPEDGAVWLVNPTGSVEGSGFSFREVVTLDKADELTLSDSTASTVTELTRDVDGKDIYITKYVKCGVYGNFHNLFTYKGNPMIYAGKTEDGNREVVFSFSLHDSNIALTPDFVALVRNLIDYSFPTVLPETYFESGESCEFNIPAGTESVRVDSPSGAVSYISTSSASAEIGLSEIGTYKITINVAGTERVYNVYSRMPKSETDPRPTLDALSLAGEPSSEGIDGRFDDITVFIVCLALLFTADWMVYCYEKYQLR